MIVGMFALLLLAQVATAETVAICRVPGDPQQRTWSLERLPASWRIGFSSKALDRPRVELPLPNAQPIVADSSIRVSFATANGGRALEWQIVDGFSRLDLRVSHGLEVNIEHDLDPAVDLMNTDGPLSVVCDIVRPPKRITPEESLLHDVVFPEWLREQPKQGEFMVTAGVAKSVNLFESTAGRAYALQTISYARELTRELTIAGIRGRFAWGIEATVLAQFSPSTTYGVGIAPLVWRWNFPPRPTWSAFAEVSVGGLWTSEPIPEETGRVNFTAHWGGGLRRRWRDHDAFVLAYRFQHFSNGNQLGSNPGVNSHVFLAGWSHRS